MTTSDRKLYTRDHLLLGHKGPAACLALHPDGTFVACGGHEGTSIWHVPASPRAIETPAPAGNRGMTTAAIWMTKRDNMDDGLAFGTEDGYLVVWRRERTTGKFEEIFCRLLQGGTYPEVTSIAFDLNSSQLAVSHRGGVVHRFLVDGAMQPRPMKSASLPFCCPQTITFGHASTNGPEIWVFNRDSGEIAIVDNEANILKMRTTGCIIGSAVMNVQDDLLALDDAASGVALYKLSTSARIRTFPVPADARRSRNVGINDQNTSILSGSDHGIVYIFDRRTGNIRDTLPIGNDWVQTLCAADINGTPTIVVGQSGENIGANAIQIWRKSTHDPKINPTFLDQLGFFICASLMLMFALQTMTVCVIAAVASSS
ncbi:hypothetical protein VNI00_016466 [Paramarasmius palmivorus]|uniref:WD40 repeat-like protein n=1 Tax=Paramarasmius palmivorus TaxID=297713 RepID=A0AAW0BEE9_9AGAR